ncbi:WD repeat, SAM and U-box domain-containing protein 1 [Pleuronectes platessa]|uniref:WD repeat, SAM and U-box domain-containing protein 1 n=1 Tax=Pleuronectes platessa TaxID=8262 RepID=UPI00232A090D|nr:WD repeat, SAM and U-box domain-containing protein 1 [Pleuronectes platessa]
MIEQDIKELKSQHTDDLLATCSADKTLSVYDTADFSELPGSPVSGHGYGVYYGSCVEFRLASCGQDSQLKIWIVSQREGAAWVMKRLHTVTSHSAPVLSCALSLSDGDLVVSGSVDKSVAVHDTNAGAPLHTLKQHDRYVAAVALSPTMPWIATGSMDRTVNVWRIGDGLTGKCLTGDCSRLNRGRQSAEPLRLGDSTHSPAELVVLCSLSCRSSEWMCCVCRFNNSLQTDLNDGWCISHERLSANVHHSYTGRKLPGHFRPLVADWSEGDVQTWLHEEELEPLVGNFKANIDGPELSRLNKETASELGIESVGLRLLRKIEALKAEQSGSDAPHEFLCPITRELTRDPVISADGYSYESWIRGKNKTSTMTNLPLQTTLLTPNRSLKMAITRWKSSQ